VARLGWRQALAVGLLVALAGGLLALQSWRTDRLVAGTSARPQTLAQPLDASDGIEPVIATPVVARDLLERLRRLESGLSAASRDLAATRQAAEGSSARLAELAEGRQAVVQRLDTLQRDLSGTDQALALLQERVARPTSPPGPTPDSAVSQNAPTQNAPTQSAPTPSADPGYAVQLIAYHSRARVAPFVEQHGIGDRAVVTESRVGGRRAYVVLLGPYGSEPEAARAMAALAPDLRALGPWVRRVSAGTRLEPWR
jgi:septal ring-binding cell division protein DamX